jgi:hypothetical protein
MKCPNCGKEMEQGYVVLYGGRGGNLTWCKEPPRNPWEPEWAGGKFQGEILLSYMWKWGTESVKGGFRCTDCKLALFWF